MRLKRVHIKGYRSLKDEELTFDNFHVLVGPNAAGKTNVFKALQFLSNVYMDDLDTAIRKDGGFESMCYRGQTDSPGEMAFEVEFIDVDSKLYIKKFSHRFSLRNSPQDEWNKYTVKYEEIIIYIGNDKITLSNPVDASKQEESIEILNKINDSNIKNTKKTLEIRELLFVLETFVTKEVFPIELRFRYLAIIEKTPLKAILFDYANFRWDFYNLSAHLSRNSSVQSNVVNLSTDGSGLADVVYEFINNKKTKYWQEIIDFMSEVVPELRDITTGFNSNKQVELFFHFEGVTEPFTAIDVSDGTILLLGTLCAIVASDSSVVCIDEPENSLHPWAINALVKFCREQAQHKTIMLATQSLQVIDALYPKEILCVYRENQATRVSKLTDLAQGITEDWEAGNIVLSQIFTSGLVPQTVPKF